MPIQIFVLDRYCQQLAVVDWEVGKKLVKFGFAAVLFKTPCTIKLCCKTEIFEGLVHGQRPWKKVRRTPIYGNIMFQSKEGQDMFCHGHYKAFWYLARNLVVPVSDSPPVLRFLHSTKGMGHANDKFYLIPKKNVCVVCGCNHSKKNQLTRHHVIPHMFRKNMIDNIKNRSYHDIVILCKDCHSNYENSADVLKVELYKKYNLPVDKTPNKFILRNEENKARGIARAIVSHGNKMPPEKLKELKERLQDLIDEPLTDETIACLDKASRVKNSNSNYIDLGKFIVDQISDFQEFAIMWREHFTSTMKPEYMPEGWDINKCIFREGVS